MTVEIQKCYVGIDVSKKMLDVFIRPHHNYMQFNNDTAGWKKLVQKLASFSPTLIVLEATGGYEKSLALALTHASFAVCVLNPRRLRDFAKSLGKLAKTDRIDAEVIALFAEKMTPDANVVCDENQQKLAESNARRRQLVDMITMEKNRLDKASPATQKSIKRILTALEKELQGIEDVLQKAIESDPHMSQKTGVLSSIKGVGMRSATSVLAELPELGQLSAKQVSALAGVAPYNCDSGMARGKRQVWGGRAAVRSALYMATWVATRHNPTIKRFYERLRQAGKQPKVALIACMHKLLIIMNAMIKHNQVWRGEELTA